MNDVSNSTKQKPVPDIAQGQSPESTSSAYAGKQGAVTEPIPVISKPVGATTSDAKEQNPGPGVGMQPSKPPSEEPAKPSDYRTPQVTSISSNAPYAAVQTVTIPSPVTTQGQVKEQDEGDEGQGGEVADSDDEAGPAEPVDFPDLSQSQVPSEQPGPSGTDVGIDVSGTQMTPSGDQGDIAAQASQAAGGQGASIGAGISGAANITGGVTVDAGGPGMNGGKAGKGGDSLPLDSGSTSGTDGSASGGDAGGSSGGAGGESFLNERKIRGILAPPRVSRNKNIYLPEELKRGNGMTIPLFDEHEDFERDSLGRPTGNLIAIKPRGVLNLKWNEEMQRLEYEGDVHDSKLIDLIRKGQRPYISLAAQPERFDLLDGYKVPRGLYFFSASTTATPGIPETSVTMESKSSIFPLVFESFTVNEPSQALNSPNGSGKSQTEKGKSKMDQSQTESKPQLAQIDARVQQLLEINNKKVLETFEEKAKSLGWMRPEKKPQAKVGGDGVTPSNPSIIKPVLEATMSEEWKRIHEIAEEVRSGKHGSVRFNFPVLDIPHDLKDRLEYHKALQEHVNGVSKVYEAVLTTTAGAAIGVDEMTPALVIPSDLPALLRNTVIFKMLNQGVDRARFSTVKVIAAGALTENTEPAETTPTLTSVDAVPTPRGLQQSLSFEAERKIIGPVLDALIMAFRLSELYDEDNLILTELDGATPAATLYGDESVTAENQVTSTMTFAANRIASAIREITKKGYDPTDLVAVLHPNQYDALLKDSNIVRYMQWWQGGDFTSSLIARGVIPSIYGVEVRRSTKAPTGTGSASATTYHGFVFKKGLSVALAASRDLMIETFRDIRQNRTVIKGHWDLAAKTVQPNSIAKIITA